MQVTAEFTTGQRREANKRYAEISASVRRDILKNRLSKWMQRNCENLHERIRERKESVA